MKEPCEEVKRVEQRYEKALDDMEKHYKDVLDKIRAEIADLDDAEYEFEGYYKAVNDSVQVIDKYREEQTDAT